jgi:hypothetical protein
MAGTTPVYGFPYQSLADSPNGATLGQAGFTAVENKIVTMDATLAALVTPTPVGGEQRANALQSLATGNNKLTLPTATVAAAGITWNGTNQYTVTASGVYAMSAELYITTASTAAVFIGNATATLTTGVYSLGVFSAGPSYGVSCVRYLAAGATICAYGYNNAVAANTLFASYPATLSVWRVA